MKALMKKTNAVKKENKGPGILDIFCGGARKGWETCIKVMLPALVMGYILMVFLNESGLMRLLEMIFAPLMGIFGLPGVAASALLMAYLTSSGSLGIAASLFTSGAVNAQQLTIIVVGIFCLDSTIQYIGRILGTTGVKTKYYPLFMGTNTFNAVVGMLITRVVLMFL